MARQVVRISLATKFRLLLGVAVLTIIAAAMGAPWYFLELLSDQGIERPGAELTRLRVNEWMQEHMRQGDTPSRLAQLYTMNEELSQRRGPSVIRLRPDLAQNPLLSTEAARAARAFAENPDQDTAVGKTKDRSGRPVYRCYRAVRVNEKCLACHGRETATRAAMLLQPDTLVAVAEVTVPDTASAEPMTWWARGAFIVGVAMAGLLAFILFSIITQRLVLRPVRHLHKVTGKVAEGDLSVRTALSTGDELQRLGQSFNDMLDAINSQHEQLRNANRALDLKLSELAEANVTLFNANKVKSEFLASVSHELRTPLNSIIGFADLLAETGEERNRRYAANIITSAKNLLGMINDLLDLAKIEAGKADVRFNKVSLSDVCQTLVALLKPLADQQQLSLEAKIEEALPLIVTDSGKLQQILYNLLSNALKFTPPGGEVVLSAAVRIRRSAGQTSDEVAVSVADTGPGIPEADQEHIFEKFYQVDRSLTKQAQGTGLGLAIAKELSLLLGGRLMVKSTPGKGAVFTLIVPLDAEAAAARRFAPAGDNAAQDRPAPDGAP
ncbi:MAG: ATP-binding protein [Planctomycetaceae bacterium]|nr:HAMP domain-containing protein [Planctomycetaceae bacterium]